MLAAVPEPELTTAATPPLVSAAAALLGVLACAGIAAWLAWQSPSLRANQAVGGALRPPRLQACTLLEDGYLSGRLYGALEAEIDWRGRGLRCDGMLRPGGAGMRLLFAARDTDAPLLFVLGIAAEPDDALGRELPVNLTIVDEDRDRFFNSGLGERCWAQLDRVRVLGRAGRREYNVAGEFYCVGALAAVNGPGSVTPADFRFSGRLSIEDE
jgi:hypothetical protein